MPTQRQQEEREYRRRQILKGALVVFSKTPSENVTMVDIAKESGFGKATLYYYFDSKEAIVTELLIEGWQDLWVCIEPVLEASNSSKQIFIHVLQTIGEQIEKNRSLYEFLFNAPAHMPSHGEQPPEWKQYQVRLYTVLKGLLDDGMASGEFPQVNPQMMMRGIGGLFHGLFFLGTKPQKISKEEIEMLLNGIFNPPTEPTKTHEVK